MLWLRSNAFYDEIAATHDGISSRRPASLPLHTRLPESVVRQRPKAGHPCLCVASGARRRRTAGGPAWARCAAPSCPCRGLAAAVFSCPLASFAHHHQGVRFSSCRRSASPPTGGRSCRIISAHSWRGKTSLSSRGRMGQCAGNSGSNMCFSSRSDSQ